MNLIQTLPEPSARNTRFVDQQSNYDASFKVVAIYNAGGPRFKVIEHRAYEDMFRLAKGKYTLDELRRDMVHVAIGKLKCDMAAHLAIINPVNND